MLCIQCGTDNPEGEKYCVSCNAKILQAAPTGNPASSTLDIDENFENPVPDTHYQSPILQHLAWTIHEFIEEGAELEPIVEAYEAFREIFEGFREEIPKIEEMCYAQQGLLEEDAVPDQVKYMITQAQSLYTEGEELFEGYLDSIEELGEEDDFPDPEPLIQGIRKWLDCNDRVCVTYEFLVGRQQEFNELVEGYQYIMDEQDAGRNPFPEDEDASGTKPPAAPASVEEPTASPTVVPSDSTDLG